MLEDLVTKDLVSLSWNKDDNKNMSFEDFMAKAIDSNNSKIIVRSVTRRKFLHTRNILCPDYGNCIELSKGFDYHDAIISLITQPSLTKDASVFVTDRSGYTKFGIDLKSQIGDGIQFLAGNFKSYYNIKFEENDDRQVANEMNCNPDENYSYNECVNQMINKEFMPRLGRCCIYFYFKNPDVDLQFHRN